MTPEQIDELETGRELHAIIAEWKVGLLEIGFNDADIYELARNCYMSGLKRAARYTPDIEPEMECARCGRYNCDDVEPQQPERAANTYTSEYLAQLDADLLAIELAEQSEELN